MIYRIVQEMVNNTLKHSQARHIGLKINVDRGILNLEYADDGKGFDFDEKYRSHSLGLQSIKSRVNFLNGKLDADSRPGKGMKYTLQVPV
jgi:signal transduction histidine kinase